MNPSAAGAMARPAPTPAPEPRPAPVEVPPEAVAAEGLAFEACYREHHGSVVRALAMALGDVDLATEAADEAFARAYERWNVVAGLERPAGWIYRVGLNWATSVLRRRRNHQRLYTTEPVVRMSEVIDPAVHATLAELDVRHRSVIVCRYWFGWSVAETALALGIREGTVKSRLHRSVRLLQTRLQHLDPKES